MKIAVLGAGAVGGYFGGRLAQHGCDVTFLARGAHLEAIASRGLAVESPLGDFVVHPARATAEPAEVGPVDAVLFAVKLWDTEAAGEAARPLVGPGTAVVSLQNGVDAEERLAEILGRAHVMGGVAQIAATIAAPGVIRHAGDFAKIFFGELDGARSARAEALLGAFRNAGIDATIADDIERAIWEKFVMLIGVSALTSVTRQAIGRVREDSDTRALLTEVMAETAAVGHAKGVALDEGIVAERLALIDTLPADMTASMANDLERGNRLELDWLSGAVVRIGGELGVATPANRFIYAALKAYAAGEVEKDG